jgi:hypothetical protein
MVGTGEDGNIARLQGEGLVIIYKGSRTLQAKQMNHVAVVGWGVHLTEIRRIDDLVAYVIFHSDAVCGFSDANLVKYAQLVKVSE